MSFALAIACLLILDIVPQLQAAISAETNNVRKTKIDFTSFFIAANVTHVYVVLAFEIPMLHKLVDDD
jgi:hypothetical protein